ncbi:MAG: response regulator [Nitrospinae bacterium]|nr:response regulator [Nitrospinota bacterium]
MTDKNHISQKILIVDDEKDILDLLSKVFKKNGYEIDTARDGIEALEKAKSFKPALILTDIKLPNMDGIELLKKFKAMDSPPEIILMTGYHDLYDSTVDALKIGVFQYIKKPFTDSDFILRIVKNASEKVNLKMEVEREKHLILNQKEMLERLSFEIESANQIAAILASWEYSLDEKIDKTLLIILSQIGANKGSVMLLDETEEHLIVRASTNKNILGVKSKITDSGIANWVAREGKPVFIEDINDDARFKKKNGEYKYNAILSLPLTIKGNVIGVLNVTDKAGGAPFEEEDQDILQRFVDRIVILIENAQLNENLERKVEERTRELEETHKKLLHAERLSAIGKLAANVAHEINNPVTAINLSAGMIDKIMNDLKATLSNDEALGVKAQKITEGIEIIKRNTEKISYIVKNTLQYARKPKDEKGEVDINQLLDKFVEFAEKQGTLSRINIIKNFSPINKKISAISDQLEQVFFNLITNARDAMPNGGTITISTCIKDKSAEITFSDAGHGIPEDKISSIFDPFFTTKEIGKGTGLGLSICKEIIEGHGGNISVKSKVGKGTEFIIRLPVVSPIR